MVKEHEQSKEEWLASCEEEGRTISFAISDVPVPLYKEFLRDILDYGNSYSKKFQDLMTKAQSWDFLVYSGIVPVDKEYVSNSFEKEYEEKEPEVATLGK